MAQLADAYVEPAPGSGGIIVRLEESQQPVGWDDAPPAGQQHLEDGAGLLATPFVSSRWWSISEHLERAEGVDA